MQILLVAATALEIQPFLNKKNFTDVLITGVGIPATIFHLTKKLLQNNYDLVIQAGIAGTFTKKNNLGDVVLIKQDSFGDIGAEETGNFKNIFEMKLADKNEYPFKNGWLVNNNKLLEKYTLKKDNGVTLNKISDSEVQKNQLIKKFDADIESMEGAAFHYVCLQQKVPFIQMRSISNIVGERNKNNWKIREAIENLNTELEKSISEFNK